jgi:DNA repair protein RadC
VTRADLKGIPPDVLAQITTPAGAAQALGSYFKGLEVEHLIVIPFSAALQTLAISVVGIGTADSCPAHMRDIYREAVRHNAVQVVLAHNHPGEMGKPKPSKADLQLTERAKSAGELLGIPLVDHLILAERGQWFSFREAGLL